MTFLLPLLISLVFIVLCCIPPAREMLRHRKAERQRALSSQGLCPKCAYSLKGLPPATTDCPECGAEIPRRRRTPRK